MGAIAAVPTMIAGIYGMNFDTMPELHEAWGYPAILLVMLGVCSFMYSRSSRSPAGSSLNSELQHLVKRRSRGRPQFGRS